MGSPPRGEFWIAEFEEGSAAVCTPSDRMGGRGREQSLRGEGAELGTLELSSSPALGGTNEDPDIPPGSVSGGSLEVPDGRSGNDDISISIVTNAKMIEWIVDVNRW